MTRAAAMAVHPAGKARSLDARRWQHKAEIARQHADSYAEQADAVHALADAAPIAERDWLKREARALERLADLKREHSFDCDQLAADADQQSHPEAGNAETVAVVAILLACLAALTLVALLGPDGQQQVQAATAWT